MFIVHNLERKLDRLFCGEFLPVLSGVFAPQGFGKLMPQLLNDLGTGTIGQR
jgi:hypothetical protein